MESGTAPCLSPASTWNTSVSTPTTAQKDVAKALGISPSTADHHVRHIYTKLDVTSRAAATLFAVQHDLLE